MLRPVRSRTLEHGRYGLHHAIVDGDIAYCSWRDACLVVVDVADRGNPKLITHQRWYPPIGGGTHNALPLSDRHLLHTDYRGFYLQP